MKKTAPCRRHHYLRPSVARFTGQRAAEGRLSKSRPRSLKTASAFLPAPLLRPVDREGANLWLVEKT
ncbi:MAG: hypothetical protein QW680_07020 [Pyrobaculum sp.]|uniref:Uncharacterized protein n=1 Tax=Pyrobaculum aerophilum TaxID=13773 RepID=A0A371QVZ4_9CREN|nr:hypothetical protein CGL51_10430 [Pyrobaculum aerophilum]